MAYTRLNPSLHVQLFRPASQSVAAGSVVDYFCDITKDGYTPIGIAGYTSNHTSLCVVAARLTSSTQAVISLRNVTGSAASSSPYLYILYAKQ